MRPGRACAEGAEGGSDREGSGHKRPAPPFKPPARRPRTLWGPLPVFPLVVSALLASLLPLIGVCVDVGLSVLVSYPPR